MKKKKILVVDDEKMIRDSIEVALKKEGYEVDTATDGLEAVEMVKEKEYDLVYMDMVMPKLEGLGASKKIKECRPKIEICIISAYYHENATEYIETQLGTHIGKVISKPISRDEIIELTKELIGESDVQGA